MRRQTQISRFAFALLIAASAAMLPAQTTIIAGHEFAWGENIGWTNFRGNVTNGVAVASQHLSGFAWNENVGWINFGDGPNNGQTYTQASGDTGVNIGAGGDLSGYAWGENIGWINFDPVTLNTQSGQFDGFAWGENVGWINMNSGFGVQTGASEPASFHVWSILGE